MLLEEIYLSIKLNLPTNNWQPNEIKLKMKFLIKSEVWYDFLLTYLEIDIL